MNGAGNRDSDRRERAAAWLLRLRDEDCGADDRAAFEAWEADPRNAAAWRSVSAAWTLAGAGAETEAIRAWRTQARNLPARRRPWRALAAALAAGVVAAAIFGYRELAVQPAPGPQAAATERPAAPAPVPSAYGTAVGERSTITLSDGSVVFLNTASRLRVDYSGDVRNVALLEGQALFEVAAEPQRPFVVTAGGRRVTALGTSFDVRLERDRLQVTLLQGRVRVENRTGARSASAAPTELSPGQQLIESPGDGTAVRPVAVARVTSWREGRLVFEDDLLADAVAEMNRYSTTRILLGDPALAQLRVSGVFHTGQTQNFVEALTAYFPIAVAPESAAGRIVLTPIGAAR